MSVIVWYYTTQPSEALLTETGNQEQSIPWLYTNSQHAFISSRIDSLTFYI